MSYVRSAWYVAAWSQEVNGPKPFAATILGERLVLYRTEAGRVVALEDRCVHRLAPLSLGRREGDALRCMYHGLLFDAQGRTVEIPGQDTIPSQARVRAYPVAERHGWIWVWMGDAERADDSLIPSFVGLGHPDYLLGHGHLDYTAEARLISDNLLDFSHISFVHAQSFDLGSQFADIRAKITLLERGIRYERWMENFTKNAASQDDTPADSYMSYDYLLPGILLLRVASFAPGTAQRVKYGAPPDIAEAVRDVLVSNQAVTPTGDRTTRYFFSHGIHRRFGNEAVRDAMLDVVKKAFGEDKVMIEAQQRVIDGTPEPKVMATAQDRAVVSFNRLVERLVLAERSSAGEEAAA
jgi:phenylpropionate dioxygenase-like ring-hydroxylating dioxygenase large terminal subunit